MAKTPTFKPGDKVYWWSELVTIIRKTKGRFYLCHREAHTVTMATSGELQHYPATDQEIDGRTLSLEPNNALKSIVGDYLTRRGSTISKSKH